MHRAGQRYVGGRGFWLSMRVTRVPCWSFLVPLGPLGFPCAVNPVWLPRPPAVPLTAGAHAWPGKPVARHCGLCAPQPAAPAKRGAAQPASPVVTSRCIRRLWPQPWPCSDSERARPEVPEHPLVKGNSPTHQLSCLPLPAQHPPTHQGGGFPLTTHVPVVHLPPPETASRGASSTGSSVSFHSLAKANSDQHRALAALFQALHSQLCPC